MQINIKYLYLSSIILLFCIVTISGQQTAQVSIPFEVYDNAGGQKTLYFGLDQTATDSIDFLLGESDLPPFPPVGAFDARFILPKNNYNGSLSSWKDYRFAAGFPFTGTVEHRLKYQSADGATIVYFSWDFPPEVTGLLQDLAGGTIINIPLSGSGNYELYDFVVFNQLKLIINYNNIVTDIEEEILKPKNFILEQNYPNPFNPGTNIKFSLPKKTVLKINVYNMLGELVQIITEGLYEAGYHQVTLNANNLPSGIYIYRLESNDVVLSKKMLLLK